MNQTLTSEKITELFNKFSFPMVKSAITKHQKEVSIGISKILWLPLVKGQDTEKYIHNVLSQVLNNHEKAIAIGSLFFYKMKPSLTEEEIKLLIQYYSIDKNFNNLETWLDEQS